MIQTLADNSDQNEHDAQTGDSANPGPGGGYGVLVGATRKAAPHPKIAQEASA